MTPARFGLRLAVVLALPLAASCDMYAEQRSKPVPLETLTSLEHEPAVGTPYADQTAPIEADGPRGLEGPVVYHGSNQFVRRPPGRKVALGV